MATELRKNVGDQVIARVNNLCDMGFTMPADYNFVNAIKMSMLKLQELKDKNGKPALEICTPVSIQSALFKMVTRGLNLAYNQCYAIVRGNQLCIDDSYFGKVLMVKRIFPEWEPKPVVIREGDEFEFGIETETGRKYVIKHKTSLENIDKPFIGGYIYLPTNDGRQDLYLMTKKQILTAWSKSSSREHTTHKQFDEKMVGKTLVNSGCNMIINSVNVYNRNGEDFESENINEEDTTKKLENKQYVDFEEVEEPNIDTTHEETTDDAKDNVDESESKDKLEF